MDSASKSLSTTHPQIAKLAYGWDPRTVNAGSHKELQFKCKKGHLPAPVPVRVQVLRGPNSCAICSGKQVLAGYNDLATTHPQIAKLAYGWDPRTVNAGSSKKLQFRCKNGHLPYPKKVADQVRYGPNACAICTGRQILVGYNDLLTTHPELAANALFDPKTVTAGCTKKLRFRCKNGHVSKPVQILSRAQSGPEACSICTGKQVLVGYNDLATTHPEIARLAYGWDPKTITAGSNKKFKFRCKIGHISKPVTVLSRTYLGQDACAVCSGKEVLAGFNDLATTHKHLVPELLDDPTKLSAGSGKRVRWNCIKCYHKWSSIVSNRALSNSGCPKCFPGGFDSSKVSLIYLVSRPGQLKIGIMNKGTNRLVDHAENGWFLIDSINGPGQAIRAMEGAIKKALRKKVPTGRKAFSSSFDGWTEAWHSVRLEVRSIRELCRIIGIKIKAYLP